MPQLIDVFLSSPIHKVVVTQVRLYKHREYNRGASFRSEEAVRNPLLLSSNNNLPVVHEVLLTANIFQSWGDMVGISGEIRVVLLMASIRSTPKLSASSNERAQPCFAGPRLISLAPCVGIEVRLVRCITATNYEKCPYYTQA